MPWLGYFHKIAQADVFVYLDNVDYQFGNASSITNRVKIKTQAGELFFTEPIKKSALKNINEQLIDWQQPWLKKQWKTLEMAYAKAAYKKEAMDFFYPLLHRSIDNMSEYNIDIIEKICTEIKINSTRIVASRIENISDDKNLRLIEICKRYDCDIYLSGNGAKKYNDENLYQQHNLQIRYTSFQHPTYTQLHGEFIAGMSIIDAWMNCGKDYLIELFSTPKNGSKNS